MDSKSNKKHQSIPITQQPDLNHHHQLQPPTDDSSIRHNNNEPSIANMTNSTNTSGGDGTPLMPQSMNQQQQLRPQYHHTTSFPMVSNNQSSHVFTFLPTPNAQQQQQQSPSMPSSTYSFPDSASSNQVMAPIAIPDNKKLKLVDHMKRTYSDTSPSSVSPSDNTTASKATSGGTASTEATSMSSGSTGQTNEEDDDSARPRTLRYNWTDYEDRLLLKIILSNHKTIYDLRYKPLKKFWELVANMIKKYSINTKVSRTHRQCRERFYVLYSKLVKFAEQIGIDPLSLHKRMSQGMNFTELEELYLKVLQVLRLEDGFKLVVNEEFYKDPTSVDEFEKSVSLSKSRNDDETTISMESSKSSDDKEDVIINNTTSQKHKITPLTQLNNKGLSPSSKRSRIPSYGSAYTSSSDNNNTDRSKFNHIQDRVNSDDIMSSPPITRLDNRSYSSLSSNVSLRDNKPGSFLKDKRKKSSSSSIEKVAPNLNTDITGNKSNIGAGPFSATTNVDDSSNSSVGSGSGSVGESNEDDSGTPVNCEEDEIEDEEDDIDKKSKKFYANSSSSSSSGNTAAAAEAAVAATKDKQQDQKPATAADKSTATNSSPPNLATTLVLDVLSKRMDKIDTSIFDLQSSIKSLDNQMKGDLTDAFDRISQYQNGINDNINLIISELQNRNDKEDEDSQMQSIILSGDVDENLDSKKITKDLTEFKQRIDSRIEVAKKELAEKQKKLGQ